MTAAVGVEFGGVIVRNRKLVRGEDTGLTGFLTPEATQPCVFDAIHELVSNWTEVVNLLRMSLSKDQLTRA